MIYVSPMGRRKRNDVVGCMNAITLCFVCWQGEGLDVSFFCMPISFDVPDECCLL